MNYSLLRRLSAGAVCAALLATMTGLRRRLRCTGGRQRGFLCGRRHRKGWPAALADRLDGDFRNVRA